jgi:hypothetical protein
MRTEILIMIGENGTLHGHVDSVGSWVVLFSLGCTAQFHVQVLPYNSTSHLILLLILHIAIILHIFKIERINLILTDDSYAYLTLMNTF